jgi:predicted nucleic acid-binding protein
MYHVLTRKNLQSPEAANRIVAKTMENFTVKEVGIANVTKAMEIHACYHYSYWDSLIIATAFCKSICCAKNDGFCRKNTANALNAASLNS